MYRLALGLLGSTLLAIPTMIPPQTTNTTPQVLRSQNDSTFAMPVNDTREVAPARNDNSTHTLADPTVRDSQPTYRGSSNSSGGYGSSGGFGSSTLASSGGFGSAGGYSAAYRPARAFNWVRRNYVPTVTQVTQFNGDPNCPCGCGGNCNGNCGCANCTCGNQVNSQGDYSDNAIVTTGPVVFQRQGLLRRLLHRRAAINSAQVAGGSAGGYGYTTYRSSGCPSCGN